MERVVQAVYENGVLRPVTPLNGLAEGQPVWVRVTEVATDPEEVKQLEAAFLQHMKDIGMVESFPISNEPPPKDWKPLVIEGEPLSETIIKMRGPR